MTARNGKRVIVVGAGVGGLGAATLLAAEGHEVVLLERARAAGGKIRTQLVRDRPVDVGPTVCTMRWVFDELFEQVGARLDDYVSLTPARTLARHFWEDGSSLDLHADLEETVDAIGRFAGGADARGYRDFCARSQAIYRTLEQPFIRASRTNVVDLVWRAGLRGLPDMARISPFARMGTELARHFSDPRLRQLFGRYATYCGSSPFLAPATLMLVAHVEREGVWLVDGGMRALADAMAALAQSQGVRLRFDADVAEILAHAGRCSGVRLHSGETMQADAVVFNGDISALAVGHLGTAAARGLEAHARRWQQPRQRSLSAITWSVLARPSDFPLAHHNVFFSRDYRREFDDLYGHGRLPTEPTVYVCAQDRGDAAARLVDGAGKGERHASTGIAPPAEDSTGERLLCLVNAPADADRRALTDSEIYTCETSTFRRLQCCGLRLETMAPMQRTTPTDFAHLFPGTGGALYGPASHGWQASFNRLGARHPLPGLFLAGGSVHPGPGVPMATLSGRQAASAVARDLASTSPSRAMAMPGGISMR